MILDGTWYYFYYHEVNYVQVETKEGTKRPKAMLPSWRGLFGPEGSQGVIVWEKPDEEAEKECFKRARLSLPVVQEKERVTTDDQMIWNLIRSYVQVISDLHLQVVVLHSHNLGRAQLIIFAVFVGIHPILLHNELSSMSWLHLQNDHQQKNG